MVIKNRIINTVVESSYFLRLLSATNPIDFSVGGAEKCSHGMYVNGDLREVRRVHCG